MLCMRPSPRPLPGYDTAANHVAPTAPCPTAGSHTRSLVAEKKRKNALYKNIIYDNYLEVRLVIHEYVTAKGSCPYRNWLRKLDLPVQARIQARIMRFEMGNFGDHKAVGEGVWEARIPFGSGYRLYFGKDGPLVILLLLGGEKATQRKDIERAKRYWADYEEAKKHDKA